MSIENNRLKKSMKLTIKRKCVLWVRLLSYKYQGVLCVYPSIMHNNNTMECFNQQCWYISENTFKIWGFSWIAFIAIHMDFCGLLSLECKLIAFIGIHMDSCEKTQRFSPDLPACTLSLLFKPMSTNKHTVTAMHITLFSRYIVTQGAFSNTTFFQR